MMQFTFNDQFKSHTSVSDGRTFKIVYVGPSHWIAVAYAADVKTVKVGKAKRLDAAKAWCREVAGEKGNGR